MDRDYYYRESSSSVSHTHTDDSGVTYYLPVHTMPFWQQPTKYPAFYEVPVSYQPMTRGYEYGQDGDYRQFFPIGPFPIGPFFPGPIIGPFPIIRPYPPVPFYPPYPPFPPFPPFIW